MLLRVDACLCWGCWQHSCELLVADESWIRVGALWYGWEEGGFVGVAVIVVVSRRCGPC